MAEHGEGAGQAGMPGPDQRERMATLLTSALERGLIDEAEYLRRLDALERAATLEEMARVVQEMPVFGGGQGSQRRPGPPVGDPSIGPVWAPPHQAGLAAPSTATPGIATPGTATPGTTTPGTTTPGIATPGTTTPGIATPGIAAPAAGTPGAGTPGGLSQGQAAMGDPSAAASHAQPHGRAIGASSGIARPRGLDPVDLALLARANSPARAKADHRWTAMIMIMLLFVVLMILGLVLATRVRPSPSGAPSIQVPVAADQLFLL